MAPLKHGFSPPHASRKEHKMTFFENTRYDPYYWLKDFKTWEKEVLSYLKQENAYTKKTLLPLQDLRKALFQEMKSRLPKKDQSLPFQEGPFYYYTKYDQGNEHPIVCRKKNSLQNKEEILIDANSLSKNKAYFKLGSWGLSKDHDLLAYTVDCKGRRFYTLFIKDLKTGKVIHKKENITSDFIWAKKQNKVLLYIVQNPKTLRWESTQALNLESRKTKQIYYEKDKNHFLFLSHSLSEDFIFIKSCSQESSKIFLLPSSSAFSTPPRLFQKKKKGHEYDVEHAGSYFFILSNLRGKNFQIFQTPDEKKLSHKYWRSFVPHRKNIFIEDFLVFEHHLALIIRRDGFKEIEIVNRSGKNEMKNSKRKPKSRFVVPLPEANHSVEFEENFNDKSSFLRFSYSSMKTPLTIADFHFKKQRIEIKKVRKVINFKKEKYVSQCLFAKAKDSQSIPISLIHHKRLKMNSQNPTLLYGYGSYGLSMEPNFNSNRLSLLDRGFVFAIAHIRGGSEKGRRWYEEGKKMNKKNTFNDFIASAEFLIQKKYTSPSSLYAMGGSAGGLLIGAVLNERPDLFHGAIAHVPFVDVLTTMLDETIPLTTIEYEEWGNPHQKKYYDYIKSYSPYDNIQAQNYPHLLITAGFHDSQVQYWEAAKWAAKLRHLKTDQNLLLLETNMKTGHSGISGRFKHLEDISRDYAFLLLLEKKRKASTAPHQKKQAIKTAGKPKRRTHFS